MEGCIAQTRSTMRVWPGLLSYGFTGEYEYIFILPSLIFISDCKLHPLPSASTRSADIPAALDYMAISYITVGSYSSFLVSEASMHHYTAETFVTMSPCR
jgi:hypothetical protein